MGHAAAIISGSPGTAQAQKEALAKADVRVGKAPARLPPSSATSCAPADLARHPMRCETSWPALEATLDQAENSRAMDGR